MKAAIMKCSILLLLILFFNMAHAEKSEAERRIQKEFVVKADGFLSVDNRYGKIDIAIGESNQIKMEVVIKVRAGSDKKAQESLDRISIDISPVKFDKQLIYLLYPELSQFVWICRVILQYFSKIAMQDFFPFSLRVW